MSAVVETLKKRVDEATERLNEVKKLKDTNATMRAFRCQDGVHNCIRLHIKTGDDIYLARADAWDKLKNKYFKIAQEQSDNGYYIDEIVSLECEISELKQEIYIKSKKNGRTGEENE